MFYLLINNIYWILFMIYVVLLKKVYKFVNTINQILL